MKQFLLGFAEGYFVVSIIIYIATYLIMKNLKNVMGAVLIIFGVLCILGDLNVKRQNESSACLKQPLKNECPEINYSEMIFSLLL